MSRLSQLTILLIVGLCSFTSMVQATRHNMREGAVVLFLSASLDSLPAGAIRQDTVAVNATIETSEVKASTVDSTLFRDANRYNLVKPHLDENVFKIKYDSFKEKMKEPWIGGILKDVFFR